MKNTEVILTENRPNGAEWRGVVKPFMLKSIEGNQYSGGFKRYDIDIYDEVEREPSKKEIKEANEFFDKVGGRYANGGGVGEYDLIEKWLVSSGREYDDWNWNGSTLTLIKYEDDSREKITKEELIEEGVFSEKYANGGGVGILEQRIALAKKKSKVAKDGKFFGSEVYLVLQHKTDPEEIFVISQFNYNIDRHNNQWNDYSIVFKTNEYANGGNTSSEYLYSIGGL